MLWCCESIESDLLCRSGDLICGDEWSFDPANQARVRSNYRQAMSKIIRCNCCIATVVDRSPGSGIVSG